MPDVDLAVIGGGINGCGIARDAAGRGLSVFLCEQDDLASGTSSASTKLIHGGLRYIEFYEFRLVREALAEREVLLAAAPHIIRPMRFVLPHHAGLRPWFAIRLGLFFYDHLGGRRLLPPTRSLDLTMDPAGRPLKEEYRRGFEYSDCQVDDARLVILNARDAADRGAVIRTRMRCVTARCEGARWRLVLEDRRDGARREIAARALVNAAGPWAGGVSRTVVEGAGAEDVRLVKGSHIVTDRLFDHDRAYIFQNADGRVCFAIPYERHYTLIGTTDEDFAGDPADVRITDGETDYLLAAVGAYLKRPPGREAIRWRFAGVRALHDDGAGRAQEATRDYALKLDAGEGRAPLLSVIGGKITTFRRLAEEALGMLSPFFPGMHGPWTHDAPLPGGNIPVSDFDAWVAETTRRHAALDPHLVDRLCHAYGSRVDTLLAGASARADLGTEFGAGLSECEVAFLMEEEWAETVEDILWRRSKLGLRLTPKEAAALAEHMAARRRSETHPEEAD